MDAEIRALLDKQAIREAQAWAKTLPAGNNALSISLSPRLQKVSGSGLSQMTARARSLIWRRMSTRGST